MEGTVASSSTKS